MSNNLTQALANLLETFQKKDSEKVPADMPKIKVHEIIGKVAYFYEKIRNAIDFKDEHLLRRSTIERIIKRRVMIEDRGPDFGRQLIYELIRGGFLPNNALPESKIREVQTILNKYFTLFPLLKIGKILNKDRSLYQWLFGIASCEIEEVLVSSAKSNAIVEFMYKAMKPIISFEQEGFEEREGNIQLYLAIYRALIKSDLAILRFHLFNLYNPNWAIASSQEEIEMVAEKMNDLYEKIEKHIQHPLSDRLFRLMKKYAIIFLVLRDIIEENPHQAENILKNPDKLKERVVKACEKRYSDARLKLTRIAVRAIIYIFITKMILGFIIEVPYDLWIARELRFLPLIINLLFPPSLMFFIALSITIPSSKNTERIIHGIREIVDPNAERLIFAKVQKPRTQSATLKIIFNLIYILTFIISFGVIISILTFLHFTIVSMFVFLFFLTAVSFFGLGIRQTIKELEIIDKRENLIAIIIDFFSLPVLRVGRWFSTKAPKINIFIFILDFIIEAPFKIFIEVIDEWLSFQKEKKEEIY